MTAGTEPTTHLTLAISRVFDAPRQLVYEAWTSKEHLSQWCAPRGFRISECDGDLRPGGEWNSCMVSPAGEEMRLGGVYQDIVEGRLVSFTHVWQESYGPGPETLVTVRFSEEDGKTRMEFGQGVFKNPESRAGHAGGWGECFDRLDDYLADLKVREVIIVREFDAPPDRVWQAWTDAGQLAVWWGPECFTNPVCELDVRPGGVIRIDMCSPDGTVYPMSGVYQEIDEPHRLVFLSAALDADRKPIFEVLNTVTFTDEGERTRLRLSARLSGPVTEQAAPFLSGMQEGWAQTLDGLASYLKNQS